jgi:CheY-like chemotaxis protein
VRDTGAGIPADVLPHIFDPFFTTKPVGQGVGLGLAQVYGIIQQHGGTVEVSSEPGAGTTFSIYLPAQDQVAPPLTGGDGLEVFGGRGELILLVEDDEVARGALLELLTSQRYRVLAAANGQQALALFAQQTEPIQLVVSDVVMPEMGGVELSTHLQAARPGLRMLLITGHPLDAPAQEMLEQGWVRWLQKPFSARDFLRTLRELLD